MDVTLGQALAIVVPGIIVALVGWLLKRAIDGVDEKVKEIKESQREQQISIDVIKSNAALNFSQVHHRISDAEKDLVRIDTEAKAHERYLHHVERGTKD